MLTMGDPGRTDSKAETFFKREDIVKKEVYDSKAKRVGTITDIAYTSEGKIALLVSKGGQSEEVIPFEQISVIGEIILLKPTAAGPSPDRPARTCRSPAGRGRGRSLPFTRPPTQGSRHGRSAG